MATPGLCLFTRTPPSPSNGTPQGLLLAARPECQLWAQINRLLPLGEQEARQPADTKLMGSRAPALQALICPGSAAQRLQRPCASRVPFDLALERGPPRARVRVDVSAAPSVEYTPPGNMARLTKVPAQQPLHEVLGNLSSSDSRAQHS